MSRNSVSRCSSERSSSRTIRRTMLSIESMPALLWLESEHPVRESDHSNRIHAKLTCFVVDRHFHLVGRS